MAEYTKEQHTQEPWFLGECEHGLAFHKTMVSAYLHGKPIAICDTFNNNVALGEANGERIVECVNACRHIDPKSVPQMLATLKAIVGALSMLGDAGANPKVVRACIDEASRAIMLAHNNNQGDHNENIGL